MKRALLRAAHGAVRGAFGTATAETAAFYYAHGRLPNLAAPRTFNEKIVWRKLNDRDPRLRLFADKISAKEQVRAIAGERYLVPTLSEPGTVGEIMPARAGLVIKAAHGSGMNAFVRSADDWPAAMQAAQRFLANDYTRYANEWAYTVEPRLLVEPLLELGPDYKFHVFGGRVFMVQVDVDRLTRHRRAFFSRDWTKRHFTFAYPDAGQLDRPRTLGAMIELAEALAAGFSYVRVDLYEGPLFGEMTFYPEAGRGRFAPFRWDEVFGDQWEIGGEHVSLPPRSWPATRAAA